MAGPWLKDRPWSSANWWSSSTRWRAGFRHTARFIADKKNVFCVYALQRIGLFGPARFRGYEVALGVAFEFNAISFHDEHIAEVRRRLLQPRLRFRQQRVLELGRGRRREYHFRVVMSPDPPEGQPRQAARLADAVA